MIGLLHAIGYLGLLRTRLDSLHAHGILRCSAERRTRMRRPQGAADARDKRARVRVTQDGRTTQYSE